MNFENLLKLIKTVSDSDLTTFKYEEGDTKILMRTNETTVVSGVSMPVDMTMTAPAATPINAAAEAAPQPAKEEAAGNVLACPLVGTFYRAASEDEAPFVEVGDTVKKGQTLAIVEAMKLMNEIESEMDGTVVEILAGNGENVEYGQPLFRIA
ncbi:MAG: acetyl-CoA carboxylase biotin carboxyl carrier protein [Lachnospiraceae bacterium]|nr:acetyl-CoA carboxylase biotin carboxyl carrier protein [Lachnospiraceae bacterium]